MRGLGLLTELRQGPLPAVICYSTAVSACKRYRRRERALGLLPELRLGLLPAVVCHSPAGSCGFSGRASMAA